MAFVAPRLLLVWDPQGGLCDRVVPALAEQLVARAFEVDAHPLSEASRVELRQYTGLVLGVPVPGAGLRRHGPSAAVEDFLAAQDQLDEVKTALFCVYRVRPGHTLRNTRQRVHDLGGEVVIGHAYSAVRPTWQDHVLPAECMVRIR